MHLATGFQNMLYEHLPTALREEIYDWLKTNAADERKPTDTDEQFFYKTRKKALGPFKKRMWDLPPENKQPIVDALEKKFEFLMEKLGVFNTRDVVEKWVPATTTELPAYAAASAELTAAATVDPNEGE